ncbi:transposase [Aliivibrio finisterrensis]|jgi:transposase|nr:transposase [Aliivibrio finisterrensis]RYU65069.1 transposase [Aliivibrio finisterrensis]RYU68830.1 transposase [Aliivibrio finisterrensis]
MSLEVNMNKKNTRRTFTLEYKQDAVKLVTEQGYSRQKAADSLGISLSAITTWVRQESPIGDSKEAKSVTLNLSERSELERLRKENQRLLMERDILKKAAVFFAKENG